MPRLLHFPWLRKLLNRGVNTDIRPELMQDGMAREAINVRPSSIAGNAFGAEAVRGEELETFGVVPTPQPDPDYVLIGSSSCNGQVVEFWSSNEDDKFPIVRVDGVVVANSENIPYAFNRPLQIAAVEEVRKGILYPANHDSPPLYWDIQHMLDELAAGNDTYFEAYTTDTNSVILAGDVQVIVHKGNVSLGSGLPVGKYQYSVRFVTPAGDTTNPGPETPLIDIPRWQDPKLIDQQIHYPGVSTVGGPPATSAGGSLVPSPYGVELEVRVDNTQGYSAIEILRRRFNDANSLQNPGIVEVVGRINLLPNQNDIILFVDPSDAISDVELIPSDVAAAIYLSFTNPKTVEYSDRRLIYANVEVSDIPDIEFRENADGDPLVPITKGVYTESEGGFEYNDGYSDPVNNTYLKSFVRGERYGLGVMLWDKFASRSIVVEMDPNYQFPNRRDPKEGDSLLRSDAPIFAANTLKNLLQSDPDACVSATFDAFSQGSARKAHSTTPGSSPYAGYSYANTQAVSGSVNPMGPTNPVGSGQQGLNDQSRLSVSPVTAVYTDEGVLETGYDGAGRIWAPRYHALGGYMYGVNGIPSDAKVMSIMRTKPAGRVIAQGIARYNTVDVVGGSTGQLQDLDNAYPSQPVLFPNNELALRRPKKDLDRLVVDIPDMLNGLVEQSIIDDIQANPQNYGIQFVSPLGIYSEPYSWHTTLRGYVSLPPPLPSPNTLRYTRGVDLVTYAGIQYDGRDTDPAGGASLVNPGEINLQDNAERIGFSNPALPNFGSAGSTFNNYGYVGYGFWRKTADPAVSTPFDGLEGGNRVIPLATFVPNFDGSAKFYSVQLLGETIYQHQKPASRNFTSDTVRQWHEPFYVVNIVRNDANVPQSLSKEYVQTGTHIPLNSCIGITGPGSTSFRLLAERWEDVLGEFSGDYRYVWIQDGEGNERAWMEIGANGQLPNYLNILADIASNGFWLAPDGTQVYGLYTAEQEFSESWPGWSSSARPTDTYVTFGSLGTSTLPLPSDGSRVVVKYNPNAGVRFFGGDASVAMRVNAHIDRYYNAESSPSSFDVATGSGNDYVYPALLPYPGWVRNDGYKLAWSGNVFELQYIGGPGNTNTTPFIGSLRQWLIAWDAEVRLPIRYDQFTTEVGGPYAWPKIGYVMKPTKINWPAIPPTDPSYITLALIQSGMDPGILSSQQAYGSFYDTGLVVWNSIRPDYGGAFFDDGQNFDYGVKELVSGYSGSVQGAGALLTQTKFPTGIFASLEVIPEQMDVPGRRTFLRENAVFLSEENGEIKLIASAVGGGGRNLYAWTQRGVCRVLTNKNVLTGASGEAIATQSISNYWGEEMWLTRNIGLPDQMWQLMAKGYAPTGAGYSDSFFWPDRNGIYRMTGDAITDISRERFLAYLLPFLRNYSTDYIPGNSGFYNKKFNEAWFSLALPAVEGQVGIDRDGDRTVWVYNPETNVWNGIYTYNFDGYTQNGNRVYGHRDLQTFELDNAGQFQMGDETREASITIPMVGDISTFKEFIRWRVNGTKPDRIEILDDTFSVICRMDETVNGQYWTKHYDGWEGWADRKLASVDPQRRLPQSQYFYLRLIWNTFGDKSAVALSGQLKDIK